jgi:hypothetical protein
MIGAFLMVAAVGGASVNEFALYEDCITKNAARLERTAEPAQLVADAAVTACQELKQKFIADFVNDTKKRGYMSVVEAGKVMTELLNMSGETARRKAVLQTMETRLANADSKTE